MPDYKELLNLVEKNTALFQELADVQQIKFEAAQEQDAARLEECMKKEQAHTLALRGFDKKREELQKKLSFEGKTFRELIPLVPDEYRELYETAFANLSDAYDHYRSTADCAKEMIEINIYKIGNIIHQIREKANLPDSGVYTADGSISADVHNRKDMKV